MQAKVEQDAIGIDKPLFWDMPRRNEEAAPEFSGKVILSATKFLDRDFQDTIELKFADGTTVCFKAVFDRDDDTASLELTWENQ